QDRERIFERWQRASTTAPPLGLGLSIVRDIVALHGGKLQVESQPGRGTTFGIRHSAAGVRSGRQRGGRWGRSRSGPTPCITLTLCPFRWAIQPVVSFRIAAYTSALVNGGGSCMAAPITPALRGARADTAFGIS
ncbi:MAG TPA: HAMP domain-containing sensor histidine kinase, partial [Chloroflexota bacterium]